MGTGLAAQGDANRDGGPGGDAANDAPRDARDERSPIQEVIECTGCTLDAEGNVTEVQATLVPDTKSGTPGADAVKVKGVITWVAAHDGVAAEVRLYERLFTDEQPDAGGRDFMASLNPHSKRVVTAFVEPSVATAQQEDRFQFERHGYFVADRVDHAAGRLVFNRTATLKDSFAK